ncbi:MAG: histidine kinase [Chloroflexi bacterium]|nr:histidine kinase [Chloroflexota bacterium]
MNLARVRSPELRPSTNTSIGRILVPDPAEQLAQKTDRTGFIENEAFSELKRFATDALNWMANERLGEREKRRAEERVDAPKIVSEAQERLEQAIKQLPAETRPSVQQAVRRLESAREREARTLREDVQLYRTLGTVGTTAALFAHESAKPVTQIEKMTRTIENRAKKELGERYAALLANPVELVLRSARALRTFAEFPLRFLAREKRRAVRVDVHAAVSDVVELFEPFLSDARINARLELVDETPLVRGSVAAIEAIVANLMTNAVNALGAEEAAAGARDIVIRTELTWRWTPPLFGLPGGAREERLLLRVLDTGPGITRLSLDDIWLPGRTTRVGGTGLGLTIVRDTVADLGGQVHAVAQGDLGGAEFIVELPVVQQEGR